MIASVLSRASCMRQRTLRLVTPLAFGGMFVAAGAAAQRPQIVVNRDTVPYDEAVRVHVTGLHRGDSATLRATSTDALDRRWSSWATFVADAGGEIDLAARAPLRGSYHAADAMGLAWSMTLDSSVTPRHRMPMAFRRTGFETLSPTLRPRFVDDPQVSRIGLDDVTMQLELVVAGQTTARTSIVRRVLPPGTQVTDLREHGIVGVLYEPPGAARGPAVVTLMGTGGGTLDLSPLLAAHGYTTFALAYYNVPGRPEQLVEMPLEYFDSALTWLRARPSVDPARIGVVGWSKGGELSLLLASLHPELRAVVAMAPSGVVWEQSRWDWERARIVDMSPGHSPWSVGGRPVPFLRRLAPPPSDSGWTVFDVAPLMRPVLADTLAVARASIPVERSRAAFLFVTARDDPTWPATPLTEIAVARLRRAHYARPYEHIVYDVGGHAVAHDPYEILQLRPETAAETVRNRRDAWARVLRFLDAQLARR
jgi:dienelactone hydrolase